MKRFGTRILTAVVAGSLIVMPVSAAPTVDELKESKESAQGEVNSLKAQLGKIVGKIDKLERNLIKTSKEIDTVTVELGDAKKLEKQQYEDMKLRIRYMYEQGDASALEALMNAKDFSDLMNKAEYVQKVHAYDRQKLNEYVETKEKVSTLKTKLEKEKKDMEGMQTEYEAKEEELNDMIVSKRAEVADLDIQLQEAVAEAARKAEEEERARREEEERKAAEKAGQTNNGNTDNNSGNTENNNGTSGSNKNDANSQGGSSDNGSGSSSSGGGTAAASAIVSAAYGQLGVPYVYGGASSSGFDCSGLVMYCHSAAGISLGHSSGSQGSGGKSVSSPQPGDVVCYAGHVGIYIGGGKMIHAPQTGDVVKVASVSSVRGGSAWYRRYW